MHPIERLRYVARASDVPSSILARETAMALASFVGDDAGLQIACRRVLDRQSTSGPLVWLVAHVLAAPDQHQALWQAVDALEADQTDAALSYLLPDDAVVAGIGWSDTLAQLTRQRGDVSFVVVDVDGSAEYRLDRAGDDAIDVAIVDAEAIGAALTDATHALVEFDALGPAHGLAPMGSFALAAVASQLKIPVWGMARVGVALVDRMYGGLSHRWDEHDGDHRHVRTIEEMPSSLVDQVVSTAGAATVEAAIRNAACPIVPELY